MFAGGEEPIRQVRGGRIAADSLWRRITAASSVQRVLGAVRTLVCAIGALRTVCMQADQG
jgi:hypothetical protein